MERLLSLYKLAAQILGLKDVLPGAGAVDGKKTYLTAIALILYAICGAYCGMHDIDAAITIILNGFGLASLRHALQKVIDRFRDLPNDSDTLNVDAMFSEAAQFRKSMTPPDVALGVCGKCGGAAHVGACV